MTDQTVVIAAGAAVASAVTLGVMACAGVFFWARRRVAGSYFFHLLFFSYAKVDAVGEVAALYTVAKAKYPNDSHFRDADQAFQLDQLVNEVKKSRNVVVMLSYNYPRRPFTIVVGSMLLSDAQLTPIYHRGWFLYIYIYIYSTVVHSH
jgi:hypothetical protein